MHASKKKKNRNDMCIIYTRVGGSILIAVSSHRSFDAVAHCDQPAREAPEFKPGKAKELARVPQLSRIRLKPPPLLRSEEHQGAENEARLKSTRSRYGRESERARAKLRIRKVHLP